MSVFSFASLWNTSLLFVRYANKTAQNHAITALTTTGSPSGCAHSQYTTVFAIVVQTPKTAYRMKSLYRSNRRIIVLIGIR